MGVNFNTSDVAEAEVMLLRRRIKDISVKSRTDVDIAWRCGIAEGRRIERRHLRPVALIIFAAGLALGLLIG